MPEVIKQIQMDEGSMVLVFGPDGPRCMAFIDGELQDKMMTLEQLKNFLRFALAEMEKPDA